MSYVDEKTISTLSIDGVEALIRNLNRELIKRRVPSRLIQLKVTGREKDVLWSGKKEKFIHLIDDVGNKYIADDSESSEEDSDDDSS